MEYAARGEFCAGVLASCIAQMNKPHPTEPWHSTQGTTYPAPLLGELHMDRGFEASLLGTGTARAAALSP